MWARPVTFREGVTRWLPLRRPELRIEPGSTRDLLLASRSTLLPVDASSECAGSAVPLMGHDEFDAAEAVPPGVRMRGVTSFLNRGAASLSIGTH